MTLHGIDSCSEAIAVKTNYNIARKFRLIKFNSASVLHIPIEHADDVNKLFVSPRVVVSLVILRLLSASITQQ